MIKGARLEDAEEIKSKRADDPGRQHGPFAAERACRLQDQVERQAEQADWPYDQRHVLGEARVTGKHLCRDDQRGDGQIDEP